MTNFRVVFLFVLSLSLLMTTPTFSQTTPCKSKTFSNEKTFDNCINLPTLSATLHYNYDPTLCTLSMAFTAPPPSSDGWVAWALNPKAMGMVGAQTLIAYKPDQSGPISVNTLNIVSYGEIIDGPISYNVTGLSSEESNGDVTIFGTWVIPCGEKSVNIVWQVGPVVGGKPGVHAFAPANLGSTMILTLPTLPAAVVNGPIGSPSVSPIGAPSSRSPSLSPIGDPTSGSPIGAPTSGKFLVPAASPEGEAASGPPSVSPTGAPAPSKFLVPASSPEGETNAPAPAPAHQSSGARKSVVSMVLVLVALLFCLF